ncbi:MAG: winged helix-turn-helix domain-containing protein [Candidatus Caldarchaeum sp.]|nr:winged helix-turn-helix domain-containing protein [Candidatus Caldarchaeum sp.]
MVEEISEAEIIKLAGVFSALGNPLRLKILKIVSTSDRPLHIKAVARLIKTRYALAYKHVKTLETAGLVTIYEVGRSRVVAVKSHDAFERVVSMGKELIVEK